MLINGEQVFLNQLPGNNALALLTRYDLNIDRVVVEINGALLNKELLTSTILKESDVIEIIHYAGGG